MRGELAYGAISAAVGFVLAASALADEAIRLTAQQLDVITAGGIVALSDSGALAAASGQAAFALTITDSSVGNGVGHVDLMGHAKAVALGELNASTVALTDMIASDDTNIQAVTLGAEGFGGESVIAQAETAGNIALVENSVAAVGTALSAGDESITSSAMLLTASVTSITIEAAAAADGLSIAGAPSLAQTLGQLDADTLAADIAARADADEAALSTVAAELSMGDGDDSLSVLGLADAASAGDATALAATFGQIYDSRSVDRGQISSAAIAIGTHVQESVAVTEAAGTGNIVVTISNTFGRLIDATDASPPIAMTHSSTTIVTVNAP